MQSFSKKTVTHFSAFFALLCCVLSASNTAAENERLFASEDAPMLDAQLTLPLSNLLKSRKSKATVTGELTLYGETFPVEVTPRGKSRLEKCNFPPLWLDFDKSTMQGTVLHKQNKLKLVTHCRSSYKSKSYLAAEMLAYRMLNLLSPYSHRVQALNLEYVDTKNNKSQTFPAFLIEHKKRVGKRLDLELIERPKVARRELNSDYAALISLYSYMIANTDFSLVQGPDEACCHNAVPAIDTNGEVFSIPYDFDSSGLVDPPYGVPAESLGLRRLTQRKFRGYCVHNPSLVKARDAFITHKAEIINLVQNFDAIPNLNHKKTEAFVSKFFETLESSRSFERRILKNCRGKRA